MHVFELWEKSGVVECSIERSPSQVFNSVPSCGKVSVVANFKSSPVVYLDAYFICLHTEYAIHCFGCCFLCQSRAPEGCKKEAWEGYIVDFGLCLNFWDGSFGYLATLGAEQNSLTLAIGQK